MSILARTLHPGGLFCLLAFEALSCLTALASPIAAQNSLTCGTNNADAGTVAQSWRITGITVQSAAPSRLPGGIAAALHVTTREHIIRSRLLFSIGEALDTARVSESVRQLQGLRFLADAQITSKCDERGGVAITVTTRDAWSFWPRFAFPSASRASAGLEETNLLGTGRTVRLRLRSDLGQLGLGVALVDPTLFNDRAIGSVSRDTYRHGSGWLVGLKTVDKGVFTPWSGEMLLAQSVRQTVGRTAFSSPGDSISREVANATLSRRVSFSPAGATYVVAGVEAERVALVAGPELPIVGPSSVRRAIVAADIGVTRRSGHFANARWLLSPGSDLALQASARADVPLGLEYEGVVGFGRDFFAHKPVVHVDTWMGRYWALGWRSEDSAAGREPNAILSADVWVNGYFTGAFSNWSAGSLRTSVNVVKPTWRGFWTGRVSAERLSQPDPDVRGLALADPVLRAVPIGDRLAQTAATGSLERTFRVRQVTRGYVLNLALFGAGSLRWDTAIATPNLDVGRGNEQLGLAEALSERRWVGSVGFGLRLVPTRLGRPTLGVEMGIPMLHSVGLASRPYIGISVGPAFGSGRHRQRLARSNVP